MERPQSKYFRLPQLADVLSESELTAMVTTASGVFVLLDSGLAPILDTPPARVCQELLRPRAGLSSGANRLWVVDLEPCVLDCATGVELAIAPVIVQGVTLAWLSSAPIRLNGVADLDPEAVSDLVRAWFLEHRQEPGQLDASVLLPAVKAAAMTIARCARKRWHASVLDSVKSAIRPCSRAPEVLNQVFESIKALFGDLDICLYLQRNGGDLELVDAVGPTADKLPLTLKAGTGHVGWVIQYGHYWYVPDLDRDEGAAKLFFQLDPEHPVISVMTVPLVWGPDHASSALQIASRRRIAFDGETCGVVERIVAAAVEAASGLDAVEPQLRRYLARFENLLFQPVQDVQQILQVKSELFRIAAEEALKIAQAWSASVRVLNLTETELRFAACAGQGWTPELKQLVYKLGDACAGLCACRECRPVYERDVTQAVEYRKIFASTRTLYIVPFFIGRRVVGVISVDWDQIHDLSPDVAKDLEIWVRAVERALDVVHAHENAVYQRLEDAFALDDIQEAARDVVSQLRRHFNARACSLFLNHGGANALRLLATTAEKPDGKKEVPTYRLGEGLTGWVAQKAQSLRIRNVVDSDELREISPDLYWGEKWSEEINYSDAIGKFSFLASPMVWKGDLVGVIRLTIKQNASEFSHEEETFLQEIATRLARIISNLPKPKHDRIVREAKLKDEATSGGSLGDIQQFLADSSMRMAQSDGACVVIQEGDGIAPSWRGAGVLSGSTGAFLAELDTLLKPPVRLDDFDLRPFRIPGESESEKCQVQVARLPLVTDGEMRQLGILMLGFESAAPFSEEQRREFARLARHVTLVLQNVLIVPRVRGRLDMEMRRLERIGVGVTHERNLSGILEVVTEAAQAESGMEFVSIRTYDSGSDSWILRASNDPLCVTVLANDPILTRSQKSPDYVFVPDTDRDGHWTASREFIKGREQRLYLSEVRSSLHLPLRMADRCLGLMLLDSKTLQPRLSDHLIAYLHILAGFAAVAIDIHEAQERRLKLAEPFALLGALLGGLQHEIRNQVQNLFAVRQMLSRKSLAPDQFAKLLTQMEGPLTRLYQVCLDLAALASQRTPRSELIDINALLLRVVANLSPRERQNTDIRKRLATSPPMIAANAIHIEMAVKMIVQNALEALKGAGLLEIGTTVNNDTTRIWIRDNGPGMDPDTLEKCEKGFFTTKKSGTGLGLRVVRGILEQHSAEMKIETVRDGGTTVSMIFPRIRKQ